MRKILCGLMALVFVLTMASCGSAPQEASSSGESSSPAPSKAAKVIDSGDELVNMEELTPAETDQKPGFQLVLPEKGDYQAALFPQ